MSSEGRETIQQPRPYGLLPKADIYSVDSQHAMKLTWGSNWGLRPGARSDPANVDNAR